jgi:hypothetical protein
MFKVAGIGSRQFRGSHASEAVAPGAELFALCQTAAADGALSSRELQTLRSWLEHTNGTDVPAWKFVRGLVEHILEIGRVAHADIYALYSALESCLPKELGRRPTPLRGATNPEWATHTLPTGERLRNEVLASAHFLVAGSQSDRFASAIHRHAKASAPVLLVRDRESAHSPNAVQVRAANGKQLGFVPEQHASELAPLLDQGARYRAHLASVLPGAHAPLLTVHAYLYPLDATLGGQHTGARKIPKREPSKVWWALRLAVAVMIAAGVAFVLRA